MVFHVFKSKFNVIYVEGDKWMIAQQLLQQLLKLEESDFQNKTLDFVKYLGDFDNKESIYQKFPKKVIEGFNNESYTTFIKNKGLVNLMKNYWDSIIEKQIAEK